MKEQLAIQNLLRTNLVNLQSKNERYSLRSFSAKVGVHVGALSSIMNGKRNVSRDLAERITRKLLVDPQSRAEILSLFPEKRKYLKQDELPTGPRYLEIEASQFKLIAEWEHYAVLSLANCTNFESETDSIAQRLNITEPRAREVVKRLLDLNLLTVKNGKLLRTEASVRSSDDTVNLSLRKSHEETLVLAKESLNRDSVHERDFTYVTMAIDPKKMSVAKEMIRKFQDELSDVMETGKRTEVYRLSMQLFPITKLSNKKV